MYVWLPCRLHKMPLLAACTPRAVVCPPLLQIITFEPKTPAGHPKYWKTRIVAWFPIKNFSEILPSNGLSAGPEEVGQGGLKVLHFDVTHKKSAHPNQKFFFECRLEDLLHLLRVWIALYQFWRPSYERAKQCAIWLFFRENPRNQPDTKVFIMLALRIFGKKPFIDYWKTQVTPAVIFQGTSFISLCNVRFKLCSIFHKS